MISRVPIAHIHGGEATEGLIDEAIRYKDLGYMGWKFRPKTPNNNPSHNDKSNFY